MSDTCTCSHQNFPLWLPGAQTSTHMQANFLSAHELDEWRHAPRVAVGQVSATGADPLLSLGITADDTQTWRVDLHQGLGYSCFQDARCVGSNVCIGYGQHVVVFDTEHARASLYPLDGYFGHMYGAVELETPELATGLLVTSASELLRFDDDGQLLWRSPGLGIDGVLVDGIRHGVISGRGEWDPPGGWLPYSLQLRSGKHWSG